jgi:glutamine synthetase
VAPGQYEVAPRFAESNIATDRNLLMMDVLRVVARKHGLAALLHEKPFAGVNGSGKHNNWSFGTNAVPSLLSPGR